jgi:hypothetical protein
VQGSDYVFAFYGGRVLSHFAFEDQHGLLELIKVNRFSAVIMDRDLSPEQDEAELRETKTKSLEDADKDPTHRFASLTVGREIENDLPPEVLTRALQEVFRKQAGPLSGFKADGAAPFSQQAAERILSTAEEKTLRSLARRIQHKKVDIARAAVKDYALRPRPEYIDRLIQWIRRSRSM